MHSYPVLTSKQCIHWCWHNYVLNRWFACMHACTIAIIYKSVFMSLVCSDILFPVTPHEFIVLTCISSLWDKSHSRRNISHACFPQLVTRFVRYARRWGPERIVRAVVGIAHGGTRPHEYDSVDGSGSAACRLGGALHVELNIAGTVATTSGAIGRWGRIETAWNFEKKTKIDSLHAFMQLLNYSLSLMFTSRSARSASCFCTACEKQHNERASSNRNKRLERHDNVRQKAMVVKACM